MHSFKSALRYLLNNKLYSAFNLSGLILGLVISILLYLIIYQELSYDRFYQDWDKIYQVFQYEKKSNGGSLSDAISGKAISELANGIPEFEIVSIVPINQAPKLKLNDINLNETGIYADTSFLSLFTFELISGRKELALSLVNNIIISEELASKYFPGQDPLGRDINIQDNPKKVFKIAGIIKNNRNRSSIQFDYLLPIQNFYSDYQSMLSTKDKGVFRVYTKIPSKKAVVSAGEKIRSLASDQELNIARELFLFPFFKTHIKPVTFKDAQGGGMIGAIIALSIFGLLIMLIACINYANLATALSMKRTKETGIRKIVGSSNFDLSLQFLLEAFILSSVAMIIALILVNLIIPWFNLTFNWNLSIKYFDPIMIGGLTSILILTTFMAGSYPALYISRLNPLKILKGSNAKGRNNPGTRKTLVIIQFIFATTFIIISITSLKQIRYIKNKELGVNIADMVMLNLSDNLDKKKGILRNEISKISDVKTTSFTSENPLLILNETTDIEYEGKDANQIKPITLFSSDYDFVRTMGLTLVRGRDYNKELITDSVNFLINETAAKVLGPAGNIDGQITIAGTTGTIIGIFKDYHMTHLNFHIKPLIITCNSNNYSTLLIKFKKGTGNRALSQIKRVIDDFGDASNSDLITMKEAYVNIYKDNVFKTGRLSVLLSLLSLWIACLGLISLSMFTSESRTKEVGIHLVMGATQGKIVRLLIIDYVKSLLISQAFAIPLGYLIVVKLFSRTAYHTEISFIIFILAVIIVSALALGTIIWQTCRIVSRNPIDSLKYE